MLTVSGLILSQLSTTTATLHLLAAYLASLGVAVAGTVLTADALVKDPGAAPTR
ncbi:hypothetical protein GCM10010530_00750 [Kribbella aluminosa]